MVCQVKKESEVVVSKVAFPCSVCDKAARLDTIQCNACSMWVHRECVHMSEIQMRKYSDNPFYFLCPRCVSFDDDDVFDFNKSLARMHAAQTEVTSVSERLLMQLYGSTPTATADFIIENVSQEDLVSVKLLRKFQDSVLESSSPRLVYGDGICRYRAASLAMFGTQSFHLYLRLITAMELLENLDTYNESSPNRLVDLFDSEVPHSPYQTLVDDSCKPGAYAEMAHIYALSAAVGVVIMSFMPATYFTGHFSHELWCA